MPPILREIIKKRKTSLSLTGEFSTREILLNQAAYSSEEARPNLYAEALAAYRAVPQGTNHRPSAGQTEGNCRKKAAALRAGNVALKKQLDRTTSGNSEARRLQGKPDQTATALLKMAEIYFQQGKTTRRAWFSATSRLSSRRLKIEAPLYFTTLTYALQNPPTARSQATTSSRPPKGDMLADNLPVAMGSVYSL